VAIASSLNRINEVYRSSMGIQFELVSTEAIMFDSSYDPISYVNVFSWTGQELQSALDSIVGSENYDIGHMFHKDRMAGGNSGCIGCVGMEGSKARAYTSIDFGPFTDLDQFDIDFASHEIGHQMGGNAHPFV